MSTKNDKTTDDLINLSNQLLIEFGSVKVLQKYWFTHSRQQIDKEFQEKYSCSYYYAKKIFNNIFGFRDRNHEEIVKIQRENTNKTNLERYGRTNIGQFGTEEHNKAIKEKYGVDNPVQAKIIKEKIKQTCFQKYGVSTNLLLKEARVKKYLYDDISFDSSWELALWIYAKDHNEQIIREPVKLTFEYYGKQHTYTPDFLYNNQIIDIKGNQFLTLENKLINPFDKNRNKLCEALQECMEQNNIIIWTHSDIKFALNYIKIKYGKNYLKQFKIDKEAI